MTLTGSHKKKEGGRWRIGVAHRKFEGYKMNRYSATVAINIGVLVLVGCALYFTESLWSFLGLLFMFKTSNTGIDNE